jgi:tRNA A-37 threonylcarbamoyl transferase component Bud32
MVESSPHGAAPIDRYVVLEYLAEGGMGAIYLGKKLGAGGFEKEVVLKQLLPEFTRQPEFIDLFLREARLSATLDHANIIHTIDLVTAGEEYFIVMEYLAGADLRTLLKKAKRHRKRFSAAAGIYITREVLSALAYAHSKIGQDGRPLRLIHRDVSPSNILVSQNGEVKLTDFGIAKASTHNSVFYRVKGKVGYMSPEQARSEPLDHRSDLYSLAVCLYEAITGERLFVHAGITTSPDEIYGQPIPLLSRKIAGLPPEFDKVMLKALSVDPAHRYQTAGEFQEALLRCAHKHGLMMSAPELADHLEGVCGSSVRWRDLERPGSGTQAAGGAGTEIYEPEGTDQIDVSEISDLDYADDLVSVVHDDMAGPVIANRARRKRAQTSLTNLSRLQGIELTSMIKIAADDEVGAEPLVDLDRLDASGSIQARSESELGSIDEDSGVELDAGEPYDDSGEHPAVVAPAADREPDEDEGGDPFADARRPQRSRWWIAVVLILLAGVGTAAAIGLSGPQLGGGATRPSDVQPTTPEPGTTSTDTEPDEPDDSAEPAAATPPGDGGA